MQDTLLLNADFRPVGVVSWERAVCLLLAERVRLVTDYAGRMVRAQSMTVAWPAVVHLVEYVQLGRPVPLSRRAVLARDRFTCQYCGTQPRDKSTLTVDHVVPRSRAVRGRVTVPWARGTVGVNSWENLVAACAPCNQLKADRTPLESGLPLAREPFRPSPTDRIRIAMSRTAVPEEWSPYLDASIT